MANQLCTRLIPKLELIASEQGCVLWMMDSNYKNSLFITTNYQDIWQRSHLDLYNDASIWTSYLNTESPKKLWEQCQYRNTIINPKHTVVYCINLPEGGTRWIEDRSFRLCDSQGECILIAGAAYPIDGADRLIDEQQKISEKLDQVILCYYRELCLAFDSKQNNSIFQDAKLTDRQIEVLKYILAGMTAKQTAIELNISYRTVEDHIERVKASLDCESKSEVIFKAIENNWITINV